MEEKHVTVKLPPPPPLVVDEVKSPQESGVRTRVLELVELLSSMTLGEREGELLRSLTAYLK